MKKNLLIRIMTALGGLSLWLTGVAILAETFFRASVSVWLTALLGENSPLAVLLALLAAALLCAFGTCCLLLLCPRKTTGHGDYVMQKGENGTIGVSVRSIEGLVQTCVQQHASVMAAEISIVERRDGIVILMNIQEEAGVNIPLAVGALQKQIKQYVSACTGLDVQEVRVMVENTDMQTASSPFAVQDIALAAECLAENAEPTPPAEQMPEELPRAEDAEAAAPVAEPVGVVMPPMPELVADEDERPLHQRLFGAEEAPAIVPAPPQMIAEPEPAPAIELAEAQADAETEEVAEQDQDDEEMDPNAVMEVIEAMSGEDEIQTENAAEGESACNEETFTQDN